jgi:glycosidase
MMDNTSFAHVSWSHQANIYEVNLRQHTRQGTLTAFMADLPRLAAMGVNIVWLMPVHPIGIQERKGSLGSYYAVRDYCAVNPEFGNLDDFKTVVNAAHALGMKLIIDWVANHTAWDHAWVTQHPEYFKKNAAGEIYPVTFTGGAEPEYWTDVVALDYSHAPLWPAMISAMAFWVRECDIDGFRCDVAGLVPTAFWERARRELDTMKPMFMLAEWSEPELHHSAFDMTYNWALQDLLRDIAKGRADARDVKAYVESPKVAFPAHAYRMNFTSNHDANSWFGHDVEVFGDAFKAMAVLAALLPGMPLILGGQEAVLDKRLAFFERDSIDWKRYALQAFYAELLALKAAHPALANGQYGAPARVMDSGNHALCTLRRELGPDWVQVSVNLSAQPQQGQDGLALAPWAWHITAA